MLNKRKLYYVCQLRYWRKICQFTRPQLARMINVPLTLLEGWEQGRITPTRWHWRKVCTALGIPARADKRGRIHYD